MIAETDAVIIRIAQPLNKILIDDTKLLCAKTLHCNLVYDGSELKGHVFERIQDSIGQSVDSFWASYKQAAVLDLE